MTSDANVVPLVWKVNEGPYEDEYTGWWFLEVMWTDENDRGQYPQYSQLFFDEFDKAYWFKVEVDRAMHPVRAHD
jgi:hypothetical protein